MNRARDFLAGMEEKTTFRACVFAAILVLMAATMFLLNVHTPLQMDDYDYSFSWSTGKPLAGVADVLASQAAHYRLWGGRSVVHTLAQLFLYWGKGVFNIANTAAYMLLVLELYALAKPKGRRFCWTVLLVIHAALFTLVPFFGTVFLWLDGACNYLWGTALALLPLLIIPRLLEKECATLGVIGVPLCFLSGWTNENAACGMLAVALLLLADSAYRGKRTPVSAWLCLAAQATGAAMMILAPGNLARASVYAYDSMAAPHYALYGRVCGRGIAGHADCPWNGAGASCADAKPAGGAFAADGAAERVCDGRLAGTVGSVVYLRDCADALRAGDAARRHGGACPRAGRGQTVRAAAGAVFACLRRVSGCQGSRRA